MPLWLLMVATALAQVILADMLPFLEVLMFAMLGCTVFLTIQLASNAEAGSDGISDLFRTLVAVYHMALGIGQGIDISTTSDLTVIVVTIFTSFVVVVL